MAVSRFSRRVVDIIGLGVAVPALVLAALGMYLTLRIAQTVEDESVRYNIYLAQQVIESFEQDLMDYVRIAVHDAEAAARAGASAAEIIQALNSQAPDFEGARFVPLDDLTGYSVLTVESTPLLYAPGDGARR